MSLQARQALVDSPNLKTNAIQRADLLDPTKTQTGLIQLLTTICIDKGIIFQCTAIKSDHHDDSGLGLHCHFNGYCADGWFLKSHTLDDWMDASDPRFQANLKECGILDYQTGLGGSAYTHADVVAVGRGVFSDGDQDHLHLGALNP